MTAALLAPAADVLGFRPRSRAAVVLALNCGNSPVFQPGNTCGKSGYGRDNGVRTSRVTRANIRAAGAAETRRFTDGAGRQVVEHRTADGRTFHEVTHTTGRRTFHKIEGPAKAKAAPAAAPRPAVESAGMFDPAAANDEVRQHLAANPGAVPVVVRMTPVQAEHYKALYDHYKAQDSTDARRLEQIEGNAGKLPPPVLAGTPGQWHAVDGTHRLAAAAHRGVTEFPAYVRPLVGPTPKPAPAKPAAPAAAAPKAADKPDAAAAADIDKNHAAALERVRARRAAAEAAGAKFPPAGGTGVPASDPALAKIRDYKPGDFGQPPTPPDIAKLSVSELEAESARLKGRPIMSARRAAVETELDRRKAAGDPEMTMRGAGQRAAARRDAAAGTMGGMDKPLHEMTLQEYEKAGGTGYIAGHQRAIVDAINAGKPVSEEAVGRYAGTVAAKGFKELADRHGADFMDRLRGMAARVKEVGRATPAGGGKFTVERRQLPGGNFQELSPGDVLDRGEYGQIVTAAGKPYVKNVGGLRGYYQEVTVRDAKPGEASRAIAAKRAVAHGGEPGNRDHPEGKKKQMAEFAAKVGAALG